MFQIGLFTTHLPYIVIIAFYAAAVLFNPSPDKATFRENKSSREHNCLFSCRNNPPYLIEVSHQSCEEDIHWSRGSHIGIKGKAAFLPPISQNNSRYLTGFLDNHFCIFYSANTPNRAPPAVLFLNVV